MNFCAALTAFSTSDACRKKACIPDSDEKMEFNGRHTGQSREDSRGHRAKKTQSQEDKSRERQEPRKTRAEKTRCEKKKIEPR